MDVIRGKFDENDGLPMSPTRHSAVPGLVPFLGGLSEPIFEFDEFGRCQYANRAFDELLGIPALGSAGRRRQELSGSSVPFWIPVDEHDRWVAFVGLMRGELGVKAVPIPVTFTLHQIDGTPIGCEFMGERLLSRTGMVLATVAVVRQLHRPADDLREMYAELRRISLAVQQLHQGRSENVVAHEAGPGRTLTKSSDEQAEQAEQAEPRVSRIATMSERERTILRGLIDGKRTATMARELFLSEHTVRNHLKRIYRKVGVHSLGELREILVPLADELHRHDRKNVGY